MVTLETITAIQAPVARCFDLARSVEVHLAGNVHWGESAVASGGVATGGVSSGLIGMGDWVTWQARHFFVRQTLTSRITAFEPPLYFQDTMQRGPFAFMQHDHYFRATPSGVTEMRDVFRFAAPILCGGFLTDALILRRYMRGLLRERNQAIRQIAESGDWRRYLCES